MRIFRVLLPLAAWGLLAGAAAAPPFGSEFQRLDRGRVTRATLPAGTEAVAVYYGAGWCGPCRTFVPELIAAYPRLRERRIEVLFVSDDATCGAATDYARRSRMPWLLLPCDGERKRRLRRLGGKALPGILVFDAAGRLTETSWRADGSSAPRRTLARLLSSGRP